MKHEAYATTHDGALCRRCGTRGRAETLLAQDCPGALFATAIATGTSTSTDDALAAVTPDQETCPSHGCAGDPRYAAPGRGHTTSCSYPDPTPRDAVQEIAATLAAHRAGTAWSAMTSHGRDAAITAALPEATALAPLLADQAQAAADQALLAAAVQATGEPFAMYGFTGCTDRNPDTCACATDADVECAACGEVIEPGTPTYARAEGQPWLDVDDPDQEWITRWWHASCDTRTTPATAPQDPDGPPPVRVNTPWNGSYEDGDVY